MQALVYIFIALCALAVGATAYFGLTFTPAEAIMAGLVFLSLAVVFMERVLRQRAEARLERAIEDLSRLLATVAQAGAVLGQRINTIADINADNRLEGAEADISVLGTVIRQVAEAVADMEERAVEVRADGTVAPITPEAVAEILREPTIPLDEVRQALMENRLIYHVEPIVTLPQRRPHGYDLVPRLMLEDGDLAERAEFMPVRDGEDVLRQIEGQALTEAIAIARKARTTGHPTNLYIPLTRATLSDTISREALLVSLDANRAIVGSIIFLIPDSEWRLLTTEERETAAEIVRKGASFSIAAVRSLRIDMAEAAAQGVRSLRIEASRFIEHPETLTDFHASDIANYVSRSGVSLIATGISNERQILELLDDGIVLVQGGYIGGPGPVRPELMVDRPRAVESSAPPAQQRVEAQAQ